MRIYRVHITQSIIQFTVPEGNGDVKEIQLEVYLMLRKDQFTKVTFFQDQKLNIYRHYIV